jgi:hypothetical protein
MKDAQVGVLRRKRMEGRTQEASAAAAGMSVRSARKWECGFYPSQRGKPHTWRTREDPFADVSECVNEIETAGFRY